MKWVASERNGVHHSAVKLQLFQIILAQWLTRARVRRDWQPAVFCPIFVVLFCKLKHKTRIFRTRNNSVSQWPGPAEDWPLFRRIIRCSARPSTLCAPWARRAALALRPISGRAGECWPIRGLAHSPRCHQPIISQLDPCPLQLGNQSSSSPFTSNFVPRLRISFAVHRVHFPHEILLNLKLCCSISSPLYSWPRVTRMHHCFSFRCS